MIDNSTFKSTYQIIKEIAEVWDNLSDIDRATVIEDIAGKRGANIVISMIENIDDMTYAYETAQNAAGAATEANEIYLDSIQGKIGQFKAQFEVFSTSLLNSDLVKGVVSAGTAILDVLTKIIDAVGGVSAAIGAASISIALKNLGKYFARYGSDSIAA